MNFYELTSEELYLINGGGILGVIGGILGGASTIGGAALFLGAGGWALVGFTVIGGVLGGVIGG